MEHKNPFIGDSMEKDLGGGSAIVSKNLPKGADVTIKFFHGKEQIGQIEHVQGALLAYKATSNSNTALMALGGAMEICTVAAVTSQLIKEALKAQGLLETVLEAKKEFNLESF